MERNKLERLDQVHSIFNRLQILSLLVGICAAFAECGLLYMICLFGQVVALILFGIFSMNLVEYLAQKKYPDLKPDRSFRIGFGRFSYQVDFNCPMRERAAKADDQLLLDVLAKQNRTLFLGIVNALVLGIMPSIAIYVLGLIA